MFVAMTSRRRTGGRGGWSDANRRRIGWGVNSLGTCNWPLPERATMRHIEHGYVTISSIKAPHKLVMRVQHDSASWASTPLLQSQRGVNPYRDKYRAEALSHEVAPFVGLADSLIGAPSLICLSASGTTSTFLHLSSHLQPLLRHFEVSFLPTGSRST
jgi:hypothetical protein